MQVERTTTPGDTTQGQTKRENVLATLQEMEQWPHWNEVYKVSASFPV